VEHQCVRKVLGVVPQQQGGEGSSGYRAAGMLATGVAVYLNADCTGRVKTPCATHVLRKVLAVVPQQQGSEGGT
jgi:hypothetical protein